MSARFPDPLDDGDNALVSILRAAMFVVALVLLIGLLAMTCGCATARPCPPPPDPIRVPVPVIQPTEPPPPLASPHRRVAELPPDATVQQILAALALDLADAWAALEVRDRVLDIYRQRAGVPMLTTAPPLPAPSP